jgi:hypothetical protein
MKQCEHTFRWARDACPACNGLDTACEDYEPSGPERERREAWADTGQTGKGKKLTIKERAQDR